MLLVWATLAAAGPWDALGPVPAPARLVSETAGPDLLRAEIDDAGNHYWIEVTPDRGGDAFCRADGYALQVRRTLDASNESFDLDPVPAPVAVACERLGGAAPAIGAAMRGSPVLQPSGPDEHDPKRPGPDGVPLDPRTAQVDPTGEGSWADGNRPFALYSFRPFQAVVLAWGVALLAALGLGFRRAPRLTLPAAGLFVAALTLRLRFAPLTVLLGGDAAFERLVSAYGRGSPDRYYGETWPSFFGLLHEAALGSGLALARMTDVVHHVNLLASAAAAPLAWGVARRAGLSPRVALAAGAAMAALPHAVVLARIEDHAVLCATLQLLVAFAALGPTAADEALAVLSAGLLAHLRPDQLPAAGLLLLPLLARRRWVSFLAGALLVGARLTYLGHAEGSGPIQFTRLLDVQAWPMMIAAWVGAPGVPLPGLYGLAGVGVAAALVPASRAGVGPPRKLGASATVTAWWSLVLASTTVPYLPKDLPAADPLRFSLPAEGWLVLLGAAGAVALVHAARTRRVFLALGLILVAWTATRSFPREAVHARPWAWEQEYTFLRSNIPSAAPRDPSTRNGEAGPGRGWYDDSQDPNGALGRWLSTVSDRVWLPWSAGTPAAGDLVFRGTADRLAGHWLGERCGLDPVAETEIPPTSDGWVDFGAEPLRFSLYRVRECGDPVAR